MSIRASGILDSFNSRFAELRQSPRGAPAHWGAGTTATKSAGGMIEAKRGAIAPRYTLQDELRPAFGKGAPREATIGDHPDFAHLSGTDEAAACPIVTLFMDIESSTRLELLYSPAETARIKNAFLRTAIEVVHALDGHVHRLQGDAVMAFFGGVNARPEDAAVDAINCAGALWLFVKSAVIPTLQREGYDEEFGIRIGVDHAPDAYWSSFGYPGVDEVTATGFGVSAAAKLQHAAGRNQIMLGQKLVELLDLTEAVTEVKTVQRNGADEPEPFVVPNITLRDGKPHNYRKMLLRAAEYLRCGPLAEAASMFAGEASPQPLGVAMSVCKERGGPPLAVYSAASRVLSKNDWIRFDISLPFLPMLPCTVTFAVENHGKEAAADAGESRGNHSSEQLVSTPAPHLAVAHWERTAYRGLHYMTVTVSNASRVVARRRVGVFVE